MKNCALHFLLWRVFLSWTVFYRESAAAPSASGTKPFLLRELEEAYIIDPQKTPEFSPCHFYGYPPPRVIWSREGLGLPSSPTNGPYYTADGVLILRHATATDSGSYSCSGINIWGNSSASTIITLQRTAGISKGTNLGLVFLYVFLVWLFISVLLAVYMSLYGRKCSFCKQKPCKRQEPCRDTGSITFPPEWQPQTERLKKIPVPPSSYEWSKIESQFKETLPNATIVDILRIQNKMLWQSYMQEAAKLKRRNNGVVNEKTLFHGTSSNDPSLIYNGEDGFEMRLCSGMWGQANYFAVNAKYSDGYAFVRNGTREIFLAKVLTGDSVKLEPDRTLRLPPEKRANNGPRSTLQYAKRRYDTVNGVTNGSQVYMTYHNQKSYPAYLIQYKR